MALIESLNDEKVKKLKSLKYGANKPLVTKDINKAPSPQGIGLQASRRLDDLERISKFFISPSGLKYLGNEALLQQVGFGQKIRDAKDPRGSKVGNLLRQGAEILNQVGKTADTTGKLVGSTLAQIPVNGTGTHFYRGFLQDTSTYLGNIPAFGQKTVNTDSIIGDNVNQDSFTTLKGSNYRPVQPKGDGEIPTEQPAPIQDFRKDSNKSYSLDYTDQKIKRETRVNLGNQAGRTNISSYTSELEPGTIDGINMLPPIKLQSASDRKELGTDKARDLIKFRFEIVTPEEDTILYFRAYLDSFADSYNGDWSKNSYLGRGEAFYTYGGFDRSINLGFKIAASSRHEMQPLYQKMVYLASATAPTYSNNFMRGTLVRLTVGDYVYALPGFLEQVNYTWQTDYPWEIAFQNPEGDADDDMQELPHVLACQVNFKPIHNFTPQTGLYHYITNQYPGGGAARFFNIDGSTKPKNSSDIIGANNETAYRLKSQQQLENE